MNILDPTPMCAAPGAADTPAEGDAQVDRDRIAKRLANLAGITLGAGAASAWGAVFAVIVDDSLRTTMLMLIVGIICIGVATGMYRISDALERGDRGGSE